MSIHPKTTIGHVHLTVADLERALSFYRDLLGFEVTTTYGSQAVFLSAGGYHHHIGLNTWAGPRATAAPDGHTGLYHFAILLPSRVELAKVLRSLMEAGYPLDGSADHGVSEAIYLRDPDNNGVELYVDRPKEAWPKDESGGLMMDTSPLDLGSLLATLE